MADVIRIKPHHMVDILTAFGDGKRQWEPMPDFGHAVHTVAHQVLADPDVMLELFLGADAICEPCVHNVGGLCDDTIDTSHRPGAPPSKREWNLIIDRRWCVKLGLTDGDQLTARVFATKVAQAITGGIEDVYPEIPAERNAERLTKLRAGVEEFVLG